MRPSSARRYLTYSLIGLGIGGGVSALYSGHLEIVLFVVPITLALIPGLVLSVAAVEMIASWQDRRVSSLILIIPAVASYVATSLTVVALQQLRIASTDGFSPWDPSHGLTFVSVIVALVFGFDEYRRARRPVE
jgi:hypothetical protein